uniref:arylamine N-acetyltransferase, pineal gland isozyme NAT-10-like n=1 Tax=Styela clava TaxID=7725 RepID=UPI00193AD202|nr:arylamine N-acetyltransferase, pineal gland isozyme NAT-10-like [Styela clava]
MDVDDYLARIEYSGPKNPTEEVLKELCWAHVTHVPFYTLDLFGSGERKVMKLESIYRKIITDRVGGMCYELNAMFNWLLNELGFKVNVMRAESTMASNRQSSDGLIGGHLTLVVEFPHGKQKIADVSSLALPLDLDTEEPQDQRNTKARVLKKFCNEEKNWYFYVEKLSRTVIDVKEIESVGDLKQVKGVEWNGRFRFPLQASNSKIEDFQINIDASQDNENSEFRQISFCVLQTALGMKALICKNYLEKEYVDDYRETKTTKLITEDEDIISILKEKFGVVLNHKLDLPDHQNNIF